jgi:CheY-like chemotaxis protein
MSLGITRSYTILITEDDADDVAMIKKALAGSGFEGRIDHARDGEQLMEQLARQLPDLVLLDLNMPRKSGLEAIAEIRATPALRSVPLVVLSTSGHGPDVSACYAAGANSYVIKPMSFAGLQTAIRSICDYWFQTVVLPSRVH